MQVFLFDDFKVEIDERAAKPGRCWQHPSLQSQGSPVRNAICGLNTPYSIEESNTHAHAAHIQNGNDIFSFERPYLSVVVACRNDDYGGNFAHRLQVFATGFAQQCKKFGLDAELIIVEWNPPGERQRLYEVLDWPDDLGPLTVRFIEVPAEIHNAIGNSDKIPFFQMIAKNVGIRRAKGKFVLATNIDLLFSDELVEFLARWQLDDNCFYRVDRYDVGSRTIPPGLDVKEQLEFCRENVVRVHSKDGSQTVSQWKQDQLNSTIYQPRLHTNACGDFTLMTRDKWFQLKAYPELPLWSIYVDGLIVHMAYASGLRQVVLPDPMRIYHLEHDVSWAGSTEAEKKQAAERYPSLDYEGQYLPWCQKILEQKGSLTGNNENWGYANMNFPEYKVGSKKDIGSEVDGQAAFEHGQEMFQHWIDTIASWQNRLYYRDQTPRSLSGLVKLVKQYKPTKIIELGTLSGLSLRTWLHASVDAEIIAIDMSFKALYESAKILPLHLSRVKLIEKNIMEIDFGTLCNPQDRTLLYVDAHDSENMPIMSFVLQNVLPFLPSHSIVVIDDMWYSPDKPMRENVARHLDEVTASEIDSLQCWRGYFAPYWKGGFFMGFAEVIPLMEWVGRHGIELNFDSKDKTISFEYPRLNRITEGNFDLSSFNESTGSVCYNPLEDFTIHSPKEIETSSHTILLCEKIAQHYAANRLSDAIDLLREAAARYPDMGGVHYAIAVCLARLGDFTNACEMLQNELYSDFPHQRAKRLYKDIQEKIFKKNVASLAVNQNKSPQTITIFALPKAFNGENAIHQRNAIRSWTLLEPKPEIILFGNDEGVAQTAQEFGLRHIPDVKTNEFGTPLVNDLFLKAQAVAANEICVYVNTDIILMDDFTGAIEKVGKKFEQFLMIGRRWDFDISEEIKFDAEGWQQQLRQQVSMDGRYHEPTGIDYFAFRKGLWGDIPPFAIGRTAWDNWLVDTAVTSQYPVVDASQGVMIIHQNHDFSHISGGKDSESFKVEVRRNHELAPHTYYTGFTTQAIWKLTQEDIGLKSVGEILQNENLSMALRCIDMAYQHAPEVVKRQYEEFAAQARPDDLAKLSIAARTELISGSATDAAKLVLRSTNAGNQISAAELFRKGFECLRNGNADEALKYLDKAAANFAGLPDLYFAIATAYAELGDLHSARKACQIELSLRPENDGAKRLLGKIERMLDVVEPTSGKQSISENLDDNFSGDAAIQTIEGPVLQRNSKDNNITISIILTVYQKEFQIAQIIKGIINNTTSPFQLVIVYDGCSDRSEQVVNQTLLQNKGLMQELKVVRTPDICELMANNAGMKTADGEYWILLQDDMLITEKGWEKRIIYPMEVWDDVFSVSARSAHSFICSAPPEKKVSYTCTESAQRAVFKIRDAVNRGPLALRAGTMKELNYFDEAYFPNYFDDMDLCTRAYKELSKVSGVYHIDWQNLMATGGSNTNHVLTATGDVYKDVIRRNRLLFWHRYHDYYNGLNHDEDRILVFEPARSSIVPAAKSIEAIDLYRIGSDYGGWAVDLDLVSDGSVVISAGVGEDISFDMGLIALKKCSIIGIDPTEKARKYIGDNKHPNISFIQKALCAQSGSRIKMYKNTNPEFVSDSILPSHSNVSDASSYTVGTINVPDILCQCPNVSILKMDIEGAEYEVIGSLDKLDIPQVCIEFHHFCSDFTEDDTKKCIERMKRLGYVAAYDTNPQKPFTEFTFIHKKCVSSKSPVEMNVGT